MTNSIILFIVAVFPVIILASYAYKKDKNKEPKSLLTKLFFGGFLSALITIIITIVLEVFFPYLSLDTETNSIIQLLLSVFIEVALVEEFSKWIVLYKVSYNHKEFDEYYDMLLYSIFVALGFACIENILYVFQYGVQIGLLRAVLSVPSHACSGVIMGYYLGKAKIDKVKCNISEEKHYKLLSILIPTISHGIFDYCAFRGTTIYFIVFIVYTLALFIYSNKKIKEVSSLQNKIIETKRFCVNCGTELKGNFCHMCGNRQ